MLCNWRVNLVNFMSGLQFNLQFRRLFTCFEPPQPFYVFYIAPDFGPYQYMSNKQSFIETVPFPWQCSTATAQPTNEHKSWNRNVCACERACTNRGSFNVTQPVPWPLCVNAVTRQCTAISRGRSAHVLETYSRRHEGIWRRVGEMWQAVWRWAWQDERVAGIDSA